MNKLILLLTTMLSIFMGTPNSIKAQQTYLLAGQVSSPNGTRIDAIGGNGITYTVNTSNGGFYFLEVPAGLDYIIRPYYNQDPLNGVNTWDQVLISNHINNDTLFTDPKKMIAADVNQDKVIDSTDILISRKVMLGTLNYFPNNYNWRFIPRNYIFPDPQWPYEAPDFIAVTNLESDIVNIDFDGIKIADVDFTAVTNPAASDGTTFYGYARRDEDFDCVADSTEITLADWLVEAVFGEDTIYTRTGSTGFYILRGPSGIDNGYIRLFPPNQLWGSCIDTVSSVQGGLISQWLSAQPVADCPNMEVELSTAQIRRCFPNNYYVVHYCNTGTALAENSYVDLQMDELLYFINANVAHTTIITSTDTIYRFQLGNIPSGACGQFSVQFSASCEADLGQTHCSSAHIYPDTLCVSNLAAFPNLEVTAQCDGAYVVFTIVNTGADMTTPVSYVVIEDFIVQMTGNNIQLANGESTQVSFLANGSTWRMQVEQTEAHPWSMWASAAIEGCGTNPNGSYSQGYVTTFPQFTNAPNIDELCVENIGAFDPNDKQGFPKGVGEDHLIGKDHPLEYLIRFQNSGTDTAFNIFILDTLSSVLDVSSFRLLGSSHPCHVFVEGQRLRFNFNHIMLPDSNVNELLSHGFVKFLIWPTSNLTNGTKITNKASIYFDYNDPIVTNETLHTVGDILVSSKHFPSQQYSLDLRVYPQPATERLICQINSLKIQQGAIYLFDSWGRPILKNAFENNLFELNLEELASGVYGYMLITDDGQKSIGRLVVIHP